MQANEQIAGRSPGSVVDIPRKKPPRTRRNVALAAGGVVAVVAITVGLSRLKAAAPTVERGSVWTDAVKRGAMLKGEAIRELKGVVSDIELKQQMDRADELARRTEIEEQRLSVMQVSLRDQVRAQEAQIERLKAVVAFRQKQVDSMNVKAIDE